MITTQAIHLGPIMLPWGVVILIAAIAASLLIGQLCKKYFAVSDPQWIIFKDSIWSAILIGLICARIGYIVLNLDIYLQHPLEMIKIQDKGFDIFTGLIAAFLWIFWKNRQLKKVFICILVTIFLMISISATYIHRQIQTQYQQFPKVKLLDTQQNRVDLQQFIGKPTVINLWASWCPPCHREMPVLNEAQQKFPDVQFVFINQGEDAQTIQAYLKKNSIQLKWVLLDLEGITAQQTGMYGLPSTLFFDAQGKLMDTHMGEITHAALHQKIQKLVSK